MIRWCQTTAEAVEVDRQYTKNAKSWRLYFRVAFNFHSDRQLLEAETRHAQKPLKSTVLYKLAMRLKDTTRAKPSTWQRYRYIGKSVLICGDLGPNSVADTHGSIQDRYVTTINFTLSLASTLRHLFFNGLVGTTMYCRLVG